MRERIRVLRAVAASRAIRRVLVAFFLFNVVEWAAWVAVLVYAFDQGGTTEAGLVALVQLVPAALVAPFGAVLGDRLPRHRALAVGYGSQALAMGATGVALLAGSQPWVVYGFAVLATCTIALSRPVHQAILPELADTPSELTAANSSTSTLEGLGIFVGPVVTGFLLESSGAGAVLVSCAVMALIAAGLTFGLEPRRVRVTTSAETGGSLVSDAVGGLRELRGDVGTSVLLGLMAVQFVVAGMLEILGVVLAIEELAMGPSGPGLLLASIGVGGLIGAAGTTVLVGRQRMTPALAIATLLTGVPLLAVVFTDTVVGAVALLAASGIGKAFFDVAGRTLLQRTVADDVLARVFGVQEGVMTLGNAVGALLAPAAVVWVGASGSFVVAGLLLPLLALLLWPWLRPLDLRAMLPGPELAIIRALPLFEPLSPPVLERLVGHLVPLEVPGGEVVIREGDGGDRFYVVVAGEVLVTREGTELNRLGPGEGFGEIALLRDVPRTATITTLGPVRLLALDRDPFLAAVTGTPGSSSAADRLIEERRRTHLPAPDDPAEG